METGFELTDITEANKTKSFIILKDIENRFTL